MSVPVLRSSKSKGNDKWMFFSVKAKKEALTEALHQLSFYNENIFEIPSALILLSWWLLAWLLGYPSLLLQRQFQCIWMKSRYDERKLEQLSVRLTETRLTFSVAIHLCSDLTILFWIIMNIHCLTHTSTLLRCPIPSPGEVSTL